MKVKDFEKFVREHAYDTLNDISYNVIGLCGEAGEVAEWVKKAIHRKNPAFTKKHLKKELGDVLHYLTRMTINEGWTLKDIMDTNVSKLMKREGKFDPKTIVNIEPAEIRDNGTILG